MSFYEGLRPLALRPDGDETKVPIAQFMEAQGRFRRSVTADAPLLGDLLEGQMKKLRDQLRTMFSSDRDEVALGEIRALTKMVHDTGDLLRDRRRAIWKEWADATPDPRRPRGWTLTFRRNVSNG